jgi:large subunit ribosomal protein L29
MLLKARDLKDQSIEELEATLRDTNKQLFDLINQFKAQRKREKPHEIRHAKKNIARLKTIITQKQSQK